MNRTAHVWLQRFKDRAWKRISYCVQCRSYDWNILEGSCYHFL